MESHLRMVILVFILLEIINKASAEIPQNILSKIDGINKEKGPFLGIVVPNSFEMNPLLQSPSFLSDQNHPYLDFAGRRFRFGDVKGKKVVVVMTGLGMLNAGTTTELLITLFKVRGIVHYGISGNADPNLQIGDVTIPQYWAHSGLWNWQRYGDGPDDELALESSGDYTRKIGYLKFSSYNVNNDTNKDNETVDNLLNRVWYQPEEVFPVYGTPEVRQHAFWVPVDNYYFSVAKKLEGLKLGGCVNTTCLARTPVVMRVERGMSANVFVDNNGYRDFLNSKFNATAIDMESAAIGLVCLQQKIPFIAIRSLSDLAGGGSSLSNEAAIFASLASQNAVDSVIQFFSLLFS